MSRQSKSKLATPELKVGAYVTITLCDGTAATVCGVITDQPATGKMGILLNGQGYFGYVRAYSQKCYRLLINDRIEIVLISDVHLVRLQSPIPPLRVS
jgi:hypothetical protein